MLHLGHYSTVIQQKPLGKELAVIARTGDIAVLLLATHTAVS